MSSGYYPAGAENDPNAPYNQPIDLEVTAEVNVELGTFVTVTIPQYNEAGRVVINEDELRETVEQAIKNKLHIDNTDIVLNDLTITSWQ